MEFWPPYQHRSLTDARRQIRLLSFVTSEQDAPIACSLETFGIDSAPMYACLSYMCGPPHPTYTIAIEGKPYLVGENCYYAMCRLRQSSISRFYWIDCICIHQDDLDEKSRQVAMMGAIYQRAATVLACISRDSGIAPPIVECLSTCEGNRDRSVKGVDCQPSFETYENHIRGLNDEKLMRLVLAFQATALLPYWTRVWIVQEIQLGHTVKLLVGPHVLDWRSITTLYQALKQYTVARKPTDRTQISPMFIWWDSYLPAGSFHLIIDKYHTKSTDLFHIIQQFRDSRCSDVRDRIYGLLSLIKWPQGSMPLDPDYRRTAFHLAVEVLRYYAHTNASTERMFQDVTNLIRSLQVTGQDQDMVEAVRERQQCLIGTKSFVGDLSARTVQSHALDGAYIASMRSQYLGRLTLDGAGHLSCVVLHDHWTINRSLPHPDDTWGAEGCEGATDHHDDGSFLPCRLYCGTRVVGFVSGGSRPGDYLSFFDPGDSKNDTDWLGMVLRPAINNMYRIIGQALPRSKHAVCMCTNHSYPSSESLPSPASGTRNTLHFCIRFSAEDLLVFIGQDDFGNRGRPSQRTYIERLRTNIEGWAFSSYAEMLIDYPEGTYHEIVKRSPDPDSGSQSPTAL